MSRPEANPISRRPGKSSRESSVGLEDALRETVRDFKKAAKGGFGYSSPSAGRKLGLYPTARLYIMCEWATEADA